MWLSRLYKKGTQVCQVLLLQLFRQGKSNCEFQEQKKEGKTSDTGIDLWIVKQEIKQEPDISELSLYPGKTIKDVIDLTTDEDKNIYIKSPNQPDAT